MRILGLDFGSKTVGLAVSDELLLTAQGLEIIRRQSPNKLTPDFGEDRSDYRGISGGVYCSGLSEKYE